MSGFVLDPTISMNSNQLVKYIKQLKREKQIKRTKVMGKNISLRCCRFCLEYSAILITIFNDCDETAEGSLFLIYA